MIGARSDPTRRAILAVASATAAAAVSGRVAYAAGAIFPPPIIVDPQGRQSTIRTLGEAMEQAAERASRRTDSLSPIRIVLEPGVYREKPTLTVPGLILEGRGPGAIVAFDAAAGQVRPTGGRWGTGGSATLTLAAPDITLRNLTVRNDFDYVADQTTHASGGAA